MPPAGSGDPLAASPPPPPTVSCTATYWKDPRVMKVWPVPRTRPFNAVFAVKAFPRMSLLKIAFQPGGGSRALAREGVLAPPTALTPKTGYRQKAAQVKRMVKVGLVSHKPRVVANTVKDPKQRSHARRLPRGAP